MIASDFGNSIEVDYAKEIINRKPSDTLDIDSNAIPKHVAIIMDGNGRWAKRRGMPRSMGHRAGADVLKQIVIAADEIGIRALTVYGFSTENWKRPEQEVSLLMALIKEYLNNNVKYMHEHNVRIRFYWIYWCSFRGASKDYS